VTPFLRRAALPVSLALASFLLLTGCPRPPVIRIPRPPREADKEAAPPTHTEDPGAGTYSFAFWNVENLFDDRDDGRKGPGDITYDPWFANDPEILAVKLERLCSVILSRNMNLGRGPDILCLAEVESDRALQLLQEALNRQITVPRDRYSKRMIVIPRGGRHIGTAILTRLPVIGAAKQVGLDHHRSTEARIRVANRELVVIASHWKSRLPERNDPSDTGVAARMRYAEAVYGRVNAIYKASNRKADVVVCGDFNDDPVDDSVVKGLRGGEGEAAVKSAGPDAKLFNAFRAAFDKGEDGTLWHGKTRHVFDQILVSPGMLDTEGWSLERGSAKVIAEIAGPNWRPLRFGSRNQKGKRGASDHFPVEVRLRVKA
jgi:endonuclease/exonuclease/phosphatase family metal-dependent hydrolase